MPEKEANDFADLVDALNKNEVAFVIIGAHAVAFHGYVRGTKDFNILIRHTSENIPKVVAALEDFGFGSLGLREADFTPEKVVQLGHPPNRVDFLCEILGVGTEKVWRTRIKGSYQGRPAPYISLECLLANKKAVNRPQDRLDVQKLQEQHRLARRSKNRRRGFKH